MPLKNLFFTVFLGVAVILAATGLVDDHGLAYTEQGIKRALVAFGVARGLNAVISTAQGTEIAVEPMGVGVTLTPGQLLDPVNDLIERLSWVLLASATALTIQKLMLAFSVGLVFNGILAAACIVTALYLSMNLPQRAVVLPLLAKVTAALLIVRFTVPVMALTSEALYEGFLEPGYSRSLETMNETTAKLTDLGSKNAASDEVSESFIEGLVALIDTLRSTGEKLKIQQRISEYREVAETVADRVVTLIAVFVIQTLLIPLGFLWIALRALRAVFR